ncbi:MAG TPA: amidohydrolase family protein [Thermodesulfobacteriota bacterium]|nr:amidohydrolase family protein [Thermodesulfobacteriota bacterium]
MMIRGKIPETESFVSVIARNGKIDRIEPDERESSGDSGGKDLFLCPGFFDPQVNGFAGVDFNSPLLKPEGLHQGVLSLASTGVTCFLITLITSSHERIVRQLKVIGKALKNDPLFRAMCLGIHIEGPYISAEDGPRGVHPREFVRLPRWKELEEFQEVCEEQIRCITLAPEVKGAIPFIEKAVAHGMVIGIGHTNASGEVIEEAVQAGARLSCHLGNAAPTSPARHRNSINKQLTMDQLMASIITDGIHLSRDLVKNYIEAKGIDRIILTTDSMAGAGASPGRYTLGDLEVEVNTDGTARLVGTPRLAGSTLTMDRAITNVMGFTEVGLPGAIRMATKNPGKLFPNVRGEMIPGNPANFVLFEYEERLTVRSTYINGEKIF